MTSFRITYARSVYFNLFIENIDVYVDDLVIAGTTHEAIMKFKQPITAKFECKNFGKFDRILNMEVICTVEGVYSYHSPCMSRMWSRS